MGGYFSFTGKMFVAAIAARVGQGIIEGMTERSRRAAETPRRDGRISRLRPIVDARYTAQFSPPPQNVPFTPPRPIQRPLPTPPRAATPQWNPPPRPAAPTTLPAAPVPRARADRSQWPFVAPPPGTYPTAAQLLAKKSGSLLGFVFMTLAPAVAVHRILGGVAVASLAGLAAGVTYFNRRRWSWQHSAEDMEASRLRAVASIEAGEAARGLKR